MNLLSHHRARTFALAAAFLLGLPGLAGAAGEVTKDHLTIGPAWSRASAGMAANGAAFLTIANGGSEADQLTSVATPVCEVAELHVHSMANGVMEMRQVPAIAIPAGSTVELKPGGYHVMLMKLKAPLKEGQSFPLTLHFAKAGDVTVQAAVGGPGAMGMPGQMSMPDHAGMPGMHQMPDHAGMPGMQGH